MANISIVIPVYNAESYLGETLNSILGQTYKDWECVLVNDGSTDGSLRIIQEYCAKDKRFKAYTTPNSGCADQPIAFGMKQISAPFCSIIDNDDVVEPRYFEKLVHRQQETNADVVLPTMVFCKDQLNGEFWRLPCKPLHVDDVLTGAQAYVNTVGGWNLGANGMLYKASLNDVIERGKYMNSDEFSIRQILHNANKVVFSDAEYIYRQYGDSMSRKLSVMQWDRLYVDRQIEDYTFEHYLDNKSVCSAAVTTTFFNLVYLTYEMFKYKKEFNKEQNERIAKAVRTAYDSIKPKRIHNWSAQHYFLFMHGYVWFCMTSYLYHTLKSFNKKKSYIYK